MGGLFGLCSQSECATDIFFGTDYHSHLGTKRGGMAVFDGTRFVRAIHNIENSPFRTKFEGDLADMKGCSGVGCISDSYPQPIVSKSKIGTIAVVTVGSINNKEALVERLITEQNTHFLEMSDGQINDSEVVAALICSRGSVAEGIRYAQLEIKGSMTMLVAAEGGVYAARDLRGRTPLFIGQKTTEGEKGFCASLESFAYINLGFQTHKELGPGEVVFFTADSVTQIFAPEKKMKMCAFLWLYYGFPTSDYEGSNVEEMRYKCGQGLAEQDRENGTVVDADCIAGVPDSGTPHAIGYANESKLPFARPLIKYTPTWPRSFTPSRQSIRDLIARMKLTPVTSLIDGKRLLLIDDSIVRGTQLGGVMDGLRAFGAKELHGRIGSPPVLYACKYLNFTRSASDNVNIARRVICEFEGTQDVSRETIRKYATYGTPEYRRMVEEIRRRLNFTSLDYLSLDRMLDAIGIDKDCLCTYCWNGDEE